MSPEHRLLLIEDAIKRINERLGPDPLLVIKGLPRDWDERLSWDEVHGSLECFMMHKGIFYTGRGSTPHDAKRDIAQAINRDLI